MRPNPPKQGGKVRDPLPKMVPVNAGRPCVVCKKATWCLISPDGKAVICQRVESRKRCGEAGWLHRLDQPLPSFTPEYKEPVKRSDWYGPAVKYASQLDQAGKAKLALSLGLPADGLNCIALLGAFEQDGETVYVFPERDGQGNVIGLNRRFRGGVKKHMPGGARGITLPNGWDEETWEPLFIVEGPTDTAAMMAAGQKAIGRPSNVGGVQYLGEAIKAQINPKRQIIVVGENDKKDDGLWPGLIGAISVAGGLAERLRTDVRWSLCPPEFKDVREYLTSEMFEGIEWNVRGLYARSRIADLAKPANHCPTGYQSAVNEAKKTVDFNPDKWQY